MSLLLSFLSVSMSSFSFTASGLFDSFISVFSDCLFASSLPYLLPANLGSVPAFAFVLVPCSCGFLFSSESPCVLLKVSLFIDFHHLILFCISLLDCLWSFLENTVLPCFSFPYMSQCYIRLSLISLHSLCRPLAGTSPRSCRSL